MLGREYTPPVVCFWVFGGLRPLCLPEKPTRTPAAKNVLDPKFALSSPSLHSYHRLQSQNKQFPAIVAAKMFFARAQFCTRNLLPAHLRISQNVLPIILEISSIPSKCTIYCAVCVEWRKAMAMAMNKLRAS